MQKKTSQELSSLGFLFAELFGENTEKPDLFGSNYQREYTHGGVV